MDNNTKLKQEVAVIDLGTNTAHILIAKNNNGNLDILYKKRHYTFLGENGIDFISQAAQDRLQVALSDFKMSIENRNIEKVIITGTEAFRKAKNGPSILAEINDKYNWKVSILTGDEEAYMIYKGVNEAKDLSENQYVIMDIGGGSVEYIIVKNKQVHWMQSFPIGLSNLSNLGTKDPMSKDDIHTIEKHIKNALQPLITTLRDIGPCILIGSAGSFEVLAQGMDLDNNDLCKTISTEKFTNYMNEVIHLSPQERAEITWIPKERVMYINLAIILINISIQITNTTEIIISPYALKEGLASDYYNF